MNRLVQIQTPEGDNKEMQEAQEMIAESELPLQEMITTGRMTALGLVYWAICRFKIRNEIE